MSARALALAVCALWPCAATFGAGLEDAKHAAAAVQAAIGRGQWDAARATLDGARGACGSDAATARCHAYLDLRVGLLLQQQSRAAPDRREALLEQSVDAYRRALATAPGDDATLRSLGFALYELGRTSDLAALRSQAAGVAPESAATLAVLGGDLDLRDRRTDDAFRAYEEGARLAPNDEVPRRKLIEVYAQGAAVPHDQFLDKVVGWEARFPVIVGDGYRAIVRRAVAAAPTVAEQALIRWVVASARRRALSAEAVHTAFAGLDQAPVRELEHFIAWLEQKGEAFATLDRLGGFLSGAPRSEEVSWWGQSPSRRHALAAAALALGRVIGDAPEQAERRLVIGLGYAPPLEEYVYGTELRNWPTLPLDIVTELAWVEFNAPELDRTGEKLRFLIRRLVEGKAEAYRAHDLRVIERHHIVLGQIFAARREWSGGGIDNAVFQLSHAILTANRREQEERVFEPLAELKELLATAYGEIHDRPQAAAASLDAAAAYLDVDNPKRASELLQAGAEAARPGDPELARMVREMIDARQAFAIERVDAGSLVARFPWIEADRREKVPLAFLRRQQFKVEADLAELAGRAGDDAGALRHAQRAVARSRDLAALAGASDLLRLERVAAVAAGNIVVLEPLGVPTPGVLAIKLPAFEAPLGAHIVSARSSLSLSSRP